MLFPLPLCMLENVHEEKLKQKNRILVEKISRLYTSCVILSYLTSLGFNCFIYESWSNVCGGYQCSMHGRSYY